MLLPYWTLTACLTAPVRDALTYQRKLKPLPAVVDEDQLELARLLQSRPLRPHSIRFRKCLPHCSKDLRHRHAGAQQLSDPQTKLHEKRLRRRFLRGHAKPSMTTFSTP